MNRKPRRNIPRGLYCYKLLYVEHDENGMYLKQKLCPYWSIDKTKPKHDNGYCSFMESGDWEQPYVSLIWDQVKECGIKLKLDW